MMTPQDMMEREGERAPGWFKGPTERWPWFTTCLQDLTLSHRDLCPPPPA